jgi:hypothetical protein
MRYSRKFIPIAKRTDSTMPYKIVPPFYPIVYVRGYAMTASAREETSHDAFYGFADTSVELRPAPKPDYFAADVFEGQLIRFMKTKEYQYCDAVNRDKTGFLIDPTRSIWISRFYDQDVFQNKLRKVKDHALDLQDLVCVKIPSRLKNELDVDLGPGDQDYKVILLAHSMGGLVCRTLIQNLLPEAKEDPKRWIHRMVTMGTPHGGIKLGVLPIELQNFLTSMFNPEDANMFSEDEMRKYLLLGDSKYDVYSLGAQGQPVSFPVKRCFCLIGSDYSSYRVGMGIVKHVTGDFSDGLVKQDCAYLVAGERPPKNADGSDSEYPDAQRAYWANVHRAHSGYRGLVNSYESFENLHRYLFGDIKADISLENIQINTPDSGNPRDFYDFEFLFSIRKLPLFLHRREQEPCENAMRRNRAEVTPNGRLFLHTAFMNSRLGDLNASSHFSFKIRVVEHRVKNHFWDHDYPERAIYDETGEVVVNLTTNQVQYHWLSDMTDPEHWEPTQFANGRYSFPLRPAGSFSATLVIEASRWPDPTLTMD